MAKYTYAQVEREIPIIVRASLQKLDDIQREIFAEEYGRQKKSIVTAYLLVLVGSFHRWYISGHIGLTLVQWLLIFCGGIGLIWILIDLFYIPSMCRERNSEIAKSVLTEQKILIGA